MQTNFTLTQLADPDVARSERIIRNCVHCGFCIATCPTYLLLGDELDSPRGRIYLIKDMMEKGRPADELTVKHIDRCLSCLSCMTTCPSGVDYMHLVDHARAHIEKTYKRPLIDRVMRSFLARVLPNPSLMGPSLRAAALAKPLGGFFKRLPAGGRIAALLELATFPSSAEKWETAPQGNIRKGRVALLAGCAQSVLQPSINQAAARVLTRHGIEVVSAKGEGCCGGLVHHMGREDDARRSARKNIDAWISEMDRGGLDAIVITTSGCGTTIKDYGEMFREDRDGYAAKAKRVSAIAKDITEYLATLALNQPARGTGQTVAYHSACSMQHGQKIKDQPKRLLAQMGFKVKSIPEEHICCGSAGVYNILQPQLASLLRARKVANIEKTKPDIIAAGNIGCLAQIGHGTALPTVHTVELIDWALGGPLPAALADAGFEDRPAPPFQGERPNSEAAMA
jgi:glycolate oxidase iron-sulfur subunit